MHRVFIVKNTLSCQVLMVFYAMPSNTCSYTDISMFSVLKETHGKIVFNLVDFVQTFLKYLNVDSNLIFLILISLKLQFL